MKLSPTQHKALAEHLGNIRHGHAAKAVEQARKIRAAVDLHAFWCSVVADLFAGRRTIRRAASPPADEYLPSYSPQRAKDYHQILGRLADDAISPSPVADLLAFQRALDLQIAAVSADLDRLVAAALDEAMFGDPVKTRAAVESLRNYEINLVAPTLGAQPAKPAARKRSKRT